MVRLWEQGISFFRLRLDKCIDYEIVSTLLDARQQLACYTCSLVSQGYLRRLINAVGHMTTVTRPLLLLNLAMACSTLTSSLYHTVPAIASESYYITIQPLQLSYFFA